MTRFLRNSMFGTLAGFSTIFGNFLSGLAVARILGVEATGVVSYTTWIAVLLANVGGLGIPFTIGRYLPELVATNREDEAQGFVSYLMRPFSLAIGAAALGFVLYGAWDWFHGAIGTTAKPLNDPLICILVAACITVLGFGEYARGCWRGYQQFDRIAAVAFLTVSVQLIVIVIGSVVYGVAGALLGYVVGNAIPAFMSLAHCRREGRLAKDLRRRTVRYAGYRWAAEIAAVLVFTRVEVLFLQANAGSKDVGLFTIGLTLANLAIQGPLLLTWGLLPHFTEQFGRAEFTSMQQAYASATRLMGFIVFPACLTLAAILPEVLPLLYGPAFAPALPASIILVYVSCFAATASVGSNVLSAMDRSDVDFFTGLIGATLAVAGGLLIIPHFGLIGAAVCRSITQLAVVGVASWYLIRRVHFSMPLKSLFRLFVAAHCCALTARCVLTAFPGVTGLILGLALGGGVYLLCVRLLGALLKGDLDRLVVICGQLPARVARPMGQMLLLLAA